MKSLALLVILATAACAEQTSYEGYKVYEVVPTTERHAEILKTFKESEEFDFWSNAKLLGHPASIMVKPELQSAFTKVLDLAHMEYSVLIENAESAFQAERDAQLRAPKVAKGRISFTEYHRYADIQAYLETLAEQYPDKVKVGTYGTTSEGRALSYISIGNNADKPTILMDGGIHAREWIAPAMALYIIHQLTENAEYDHLSKEVNWVIIPVSNPDGYEYSHTNSRMWRKTRSRGTICYGADANRNYGYMWGGLGTSSNECSDIFHGSRAFSEPETAAFRDFAHGLDNIVLYIALHSYGNWVLFPWGYDYVLAENDDQLQALGDQIAAAIEAVAGTSYTVGNAAYLLYPAAGATDDWMLAEGGAELSYTLELPGGGSQGFDLPPSRIQPVVTETWQGILTAYNYVQSKVK